MPRKRKNKTGHVGEADLSMAKARKKKKKKKKADASLSRRLAKVERHVKALDVEVITRSRLRAAWKDAIEKAGLGKDFLNK